MIDRSIKIIYFYLENYAPLYESLGTKIFEFDRSNSTNSLVLILGGNGSGKSFLINELTPLPLEHVAYRTTSRIIPGENGKKIITYLVDDYIKYTCEILYFADKKTQCFFKKQMGQDEPIELNPNGNVNSYIDLLETEFGLTKSYTNIGYFSSSVRNIVDMTPKERYDLISNWLPNINEPLQAYKTVQKKYNLIKREIDILTKDITKITVDEYKQELNRNNFALIDREKQLQLIRQHISEGKILLQGVNNLDSFTFITDLKKYKQNVEELNKKTESLNELIKELSEYSGEDGNKKLQEDILYYQNEKVKLTQIIENDNNNLSRLKSEIDSLIPQIDNNKVNKSLTDIITSLDYLNKELNDLNEFKNNISKNHPNIIYIDELVSNNISQILYLFYDIYQIIEKIKLLLSDNSIDDILNNTEYIINDLNNKELEYMNNINNIKNIINEKEKRIYLLQNNGVDSELINKAPKMCTPSSCPLLRELLTYIKPEDEILELQNEIINLNNNLSLQTSILESNIQNNKNNITKIFNYIDEINNILQRNSDKLGTLPEELLKIINVDNVQLIKSIEFIIEELKNWDEYNSLCIKIDKIVNSLIQLEQLKSLTLIHNNQVTNLEQYTIEYQNIQNNRIKNIELLQNIQNKIDTISTFEEKQKNFNKLLKEYNNYYINLTETRKQLLIYNKRLYYKKHASKIISEKIKEEQSLIDTITTLKQSIQDISNKIMSQSVLEKRRDELTKRLDTYDTLMNVWSPRVGYPSLIIQMFLDTVKDITNRDLKEIWGGILQIKDFIINNNEFSITIQKGNVIINDASEASGAERATLSLAVSLAIIEVNSLDMLYNIIRLDESDAAFDDTRRQTFLDTITTRLDLINCKNCYVITHNNSFENIEADVILLPNSNISTNYLSNKNILFSA